MGDDIDTRDALSAGWRDRWPRHCRACRGWGVDLVRLVTADADAGLDPDPPAVILCQAMRPTQCHRCAGLGLPDGATACQYCGWEFDDGC